MCGIYYQQDHILLHDILSWLAYYAAYQAKKDALNLDLVDEVEYEIENI